MNSKIKRLMQGTRGELYSHPEGEFVLYEDHIAKVNHLCDVLHGIKTQMALQKQVSRNQDKEWFDYSIKYIEQEISKTENDLDLASPAIETAEGEKE